MIQQPAWQFDELSQVGVDYADPAEVAAYEERHRRFRDLDGENRRLIERLGLSGHETLIDIGSGTGLFILAAAPHCAKIHAVDVSEAMLAFAQGRAKEAGVANIAFHRGGFLTYEHAGEPADVIVTAAALHHLPDFWKQVGLNRLAAMLKPGGRLYVKDVVWSFDPAGYRAFFDGWLADTPAVRDQALVHARQEFSTTAWIMEGLLERAGLTIESVEHHGGFMAEYFCRRRE